MKMEKVKITLNFMVDVEVIKCLLQKRGLDVNMANIKKAVSLYKERRYSLNDETLFDDFPSDKETLLMYGFKITRKGKG